MWRCALALVVFWTWAVPVRADGIPINLQTTEGMDLPWVRHLQESFIPAVDAALADSRLSVDWQLHLGDGVMEPGREIDALGHNAANIAVVPTLTNACRSIITTSRS